MCSQMSIPHMGFRNGFFLIVQGKVTVALHCNGDLTTAWLNAPSGASSCTDGFGMAADTSVEVSSGAALVNNQT